MSVRNIKVLMVAICVLPFLSACTAKKKTGAVSMAIPSTLKSNKVGALAIAQPVQHVVINISGEGIPDTMKWTWDSHDCNRSNTYASCSPPATVTVPDIPNGQKLIQVLFVTGDEEVSGSFWYGDTSVVIEGAETAANVSISEYGNQSKLTSGVISGRYFANVYDTDGTTVINVINPSGIVYARLPIAGKRPMVIETAEMYAGWFTIFGLKEVALSYDLAGYGPLFGMQVKLDPTASPTNYPGVGGGQDYFATIGEAFQIWDGRREEESYALLGSFGNGAADPVNTMQACEYYMPSTPYIYYGKLDMSGATPAVYDWETQVSLAGYPGADPALCPDDVPFDYINHFGFNPAAHDSGGNREVTGMRGPFFGMYNGNHFEYVSFDHLDSTEETIYWNFLPDTDQYIRGVKLFARARQEGQNSDDYRVKGGDGIDCANLAAKGFTALNGGNEVPSSNNMLELVDLSASQESVVIICPIRNDGVMLTGAIEGYYHNDDFVGVGGGGSMNEYPEFSISGPNVIANDSSTPPCTPYRLEAKKFGEPMGFGPYSNLLLNSSNSSLGVYSDSSCSTSIRGTSVPIVNSDKVYYDFYVKSFSNPIVLSGTLSASLTGSGVPPIGASKALAIAPKPSTPNFTIKIMGPMAIKAQHCYPVTFMKWHQGTNIGMMVNGSFFPSATLPSGFEFFYDNGTDAPCAGSSMSSFSMTGDTYKRFYFRYIGTGTDSTVTMNLTTADPFLPLTMAVLRPGEPARLRVETSWQMEANDCKAVKLIVTDRNGNPTGIDAASSIDLYSLFGLGNFYDNATCSSTTTSTVGLAIGQSTKFVYYKPAVDGDDTLVAKINRTLPDNDLVGLVNVYISPPSAQYLFITDSGQTLNEGTNPPILGTPSAVPYSSQFTVTIHAFMNDWYLDSGYMPPPPYSGTITSGDISLSGGLIFVSATAWVNGQATVTLEAPAAGSSGSINFINAPKSNGMGSLQFTNSWTVNYN